MFRNKVCQFFYAGIHPRWTFGFAKGWSLRSRKKGLIKLPEDPKEATGYLIDFATEYAQIHPDIRFFIFGHRHSLLDMDLAQNARILVAGDWMKYFSYIQWDGNSLTLELYKGKFSK